nr:hypothetical protein [Zobellia laminariae]
MNDFYIFQYLDSVNFTNNQSITVIFVNQRKYPKQKKLIDELEFFFQSHLLTDKLVIILPEYSNQEIKGYFSDGIMETFRRVPGFNKKYSQDCCFVYQFDVSGCFTSYAKKKSA